MNPISALPKNLRWIHHRLVIWILAIALIFSLISLLMGHRDWAFSAALGLVASYLILIDLFTQRATKKVSRQQIMGGLFKRLVYYGVPVFLAIKFPGYLSLPVTLICLFAFQIHYIGFEIVYNYLHFKRKS